MQDNKIDFSIFKIKKSILFSKFIFSLISLFFIGTAIAFNNLARLGNDPVSVFLDGVRNLISKINHANNTNDLAIATYLVSIVLFILVLVIKRKYVNIGTLIYTFLLGTFISLGIKLYYMLGFRGASQDSMQIILNLISSTKINTQELMFQIVISMIVCLLLFLGISIFILINIGLDPFTALAMIFSDFTKIPFKISKIILDILFLLLGWMFGGEVGIVTIVAACLGGPIINRFVILFKKLGIKAFD